MNKNWPKWLAAGVVLCGLCVLVALSGRNSVDAKAEAQGSMTANGQAGSHKQFWHCGMHPQVIRDYPGDCPICHMALTPINPNASGDPPKQGKQLWWDPMLGPSSLADHPGKSAMGMDLVPYTGTAAGGPEIEIDPLIVQDMGVQTVSVTRGPLHKTIHAVGLFELPQPGLHDIALKTGGWIDKLYVDQDGMHVHKGDPLFAIYSQELQVAGQELLSAVQSQRSLPADASPALRKDAQDLVDSARRKLQLWDVDEREIEAITKADRPPREVTFYSPATGHLEDKMVVQGSAVQPGVKLMRIADHSVMWLDAQVYEEQIPLVKIGQTVEVTLDAAPGKTFTGKVTFMYPHLDHMTRTLTVRATFDNPNFELKPGMYAEADLVSEPAADAVQVPQEAVIDTGTKQTVFVALGNGHFSPRTVRPGVRGDGDKIQILEGLSAGETVVTSGQFLMDVESRTQEAIAKLSGGPVPSSEPGAPAAPTDLPTATPPIGPATMSTGSNQEPTVQPTSQPVTPAQLSLVYCPMVKADWLQPPGPISNPYLDANMRDCGQLKIQLPAPPTNSPLARVIDDYLAVQHSLTTGHYDATLGERMRADCAKLKGDAYATLRQAADHFAAAHDQKTAQLEFVSVSRALIPLLKPGSQK